MNWLGISMGAASQGLRLLRSSGAVKVAYVPGNRRSHYVADLDLSNFATIFLKEELRPRMNRVLKCIKRMEELAAVMTPQKHKSAHVKIERPRQWLEKGQKMIPWILNFLVL
ncbi:MAG: hypothetical protein RIQ71_660 [Verrucomicrobiota bacterium]|jgi:DNA-binding transcriptional regulator GbsR (MarR family)